MKMICTSALAATTLLWTASVRAQAEPPPASPEQGTQPEQDAEPPLGDDTC